LYCSIQPTLQELGNDVVNAFGLLVLACARRQSKEKIVEARITIRILSLVNCMPAKKAENAIERDARNELLRSLVMASFLGGFLGVRDQHFS
jgi:hypothetical protein